MYFCGRDKYLLNDKQILLTVVLLQIAWVIKANKVHWKFFQCFTIINIVTNKLTSARQYKKFLCTSKIVFVLSVFNLSLSLIFLLFDVSLLFLKYIYIYLLHGCCPNLFCLLLKLIIDFLVFSKLHKTYVLVYFWFFLVLQIYPSLSYIF